MRGVTVEVAARKFGVPFECPCCGAAPETDVRVTARGTGQSLMFPYCRRCVMHAHRWDSAGIASAGVMVLGIALAIALAVVAKVIAGVIAFAAAATFAWFVRSARHGAARAACGPSCASPGMAVTYLGWSGVSSSFQFESPTFAARFAEQNTSVLANESADLRKLRERYHKARLAVPTPAVAAGTAPPPLTMREWQARLENTEGTVARRVALGRALEMVEAAHDRRELLQTVARIELEPLLARLQRVANPAAKKDLLRKAIEDIRADNISDELEAAEVGQLEARLAELG